MAANQRAIASDEMLLFNFGVSQRTAAPAAARP
jgi:hypothetical protein